jgi:hypothetical protein
VAVEGLVSLEAIGEVGEGSAECLRLSLGQAQTRGGEKQGINTAAQCATPCLDRFPHKPGALAEEVHDEIAR